MSFQKSYYNFKRLLINPALYKKSSRYLIFQKRFEPFFWIKINWMSTTKVLPLYYDLPTSLRYRRRLRSYFLNEYRTGYYLFLNMIAYWDFSKALDHSFKTFRLSILSSFINSYRYLFYQYLTENFFSMRRIRTSKSSTLFRLFFTFKTNKLFVTMKNTKNESLIFLSLGFFLKYFEKRKVLKKSKAFKLLLARSLRKIFLLSRLNKFFFFIRGIPLYFVEMLRTLNQRIDHPFFNPYDKLVFDESNPRTTLSLIKVPYFFFIKNVSFVPSKTRKRGRIKRKLRRRLFVKNRVSD